MRSWAVLAAALFLLLGAAAVPAQTPDCALAPGWEQSGGARLYEGENLYDYMNGNSEGYYIYGFKLMRGVTCKKGGDTIHIDISEMADPEYAYGMFTANRDQRQPAEKIGAGGQVVPRKAIAAKGKYYLEIAAEPDKDHSPMLRELITALAAKVPGSTDVPAALTWFPTAGLTTGHPRLVPQSVMGVGALKRGYLAVYEDKSKAFVVTEASPEAATAVMSKLRGRWEGSAAAQVAGTDEAFTVTDKYLGKIAVFRKGTRVAGYASVPESGDAVALAGQLAGKLR